MDHHLDCFGNVRVEQGITEWCAVATRKITYRSWFERTWTFQELMLAQDAELICGPHHLPWRVMKKILSTGGYRNFYQPKQKGLELTEYLEFSTQSYAFNSTSHNAISFMSLLSFRKFSKCSDPRDKVVALLGLADDLDYGLAGSGSKPASEFIRPDYQEPVEDLYLKTAHYLLQSTHSLQLLRCVIPTSTQNNLPSWVPDWRHAEWPRGSPYHWFQQATRGSVHQTSLSGDSLDQTKLRFSGIKQDCISALSCYNENFAEEFFQQPHDIEVYLPTMQPVGLAIKQTTMRENWSNADPVARAVFFGLSTSVVSDDVADECGHAFEKQLAFLNDQFHERDSTVKMFRGSKGFIGFGPRSMQIGDEIYLLLGLNCPVVLRLMEGCYRFVGCCYVHGLMYGEGLHPGRKPLPCNYPGSSRLDEFWPLLWSEQVVKERNACRSPQWLMFKGGKSEAYTYFEDHFLELINDSYILSPDWKPP